MTDSPAHSNPGLLADRYRVERRIGAGAHATTWLAHDERLQRPVAVKMLRQQLADDPVFVQRFGAEARAAASVRQTNVVDVYDFGQHEGQLYIIMQYVDGEDLKALIEREGPLPTRRAIEIAGHVLDGLQAIHAAGIVHRDIKPQNVLIGTDGVARVADFGVAEAVATQGLTAEGFTIGTVDYMAPEQAQGLPLTPSADVYATGVMLYEMLTGSLPFRGDSPREVMLGHINGELVPPSVRLPGHGISRMLDAVVAQSMAKEPNRRFGSARAMKQALMSASSGSASETRTTQVATAPPPVRRAPARQAVPVAPPMDDTSTAGSGLNGAFVALLVLLLIGVLGIGAWAGAQWLDGRGVDLPFNVPGITQDADETPAPTDTPPPPTEPAVMEPGPPTAPPVEQQPVTPEEEQPTDPPVEAPPPTEVPVEVPPTAIPTEPPVEDDSDIPLIEPVDQEPTSEPAG